MNARIAKIAVACALACATRLHADLRPRLDAVPCVPGGIAAIPLERTAGEPWPARIPVRIGDLRSSAPLIWVGARADDGVRSWTRAPEQVDAVPLAEMPASPEPESVGEVFAMVELPASGEGAIEVGGLPVTARWLPVPRRVRSDAPVLSIPSTVADDRPDPASSVEHWRWTLVAERQGARVGDPRGDAADRLWARHVENLWLAGLERVRGTSKGIHAELVELLTACIEDLDHGKQVAAWVARPGELRALLSILVDVDRSDADAAQAALTWLRNRWTCTAWIEEDVADRVLLAVANPLGGERVLKAEWIGSAGQSETASIVARPRRITRAWIDRPALAPGSESIAIDRIRTEALELADGAARLRLGVGAREYPVRPPGLAFGTFVPPLSLADAQAGSIGPPPAPWRTQASLRLRQGTWELFIEAFRPAGAGGLAADRVTVRIGDPASPAQCFAVAADGSLQMVAGPDDGVTAGFMAWDDRWRARIELPEAWLPSSMPGARPLLLSVERTAPGAGGTQSAGLARPPWLGRAAPILVDLAAWDELER